MRLRLEIRFIQYYYKYCKNIYTINKQPSIPETVDAFPLPKADTVGKISISPPADFVNPFTYRHYHVQYF